MSLEALLTTANQFIPVIGLGGVGAIGIALWRGGFASGQRKREVDQLIVDVKAIKGQINNGGLKEAISEMRTTCGKSMASVEQKLDDHIAMAGHPGVREDIATLKADVKNLKDKRG